MSEVCICCYFVVQGLLKVNKVLSALADWLDWLLLKTQPHDSISSPYSWTISCSSYLPLLYWYLCVMCHPPPPTPPLQCPCRPVLSAQGGRFFMWKLVKLSWGAIHSQVLGSSCRGVSLPQKRCLLPQSSALLSQTAQLRGNTHTLRHAVATWVLYRKSPWTHSANHSRRHQGEGKC